MLRQVDDGIRVDDVCRKMGISEATYYNWKKKFGGLGIIKLRRLRQLEENNRLKQILADLTWDKQMLQKALKKVSEAPVAKAGSCKTDIRLPLFYKEIL